MQKHMEEIVRKVRLPLAFHKQIAALMILFNQNTFFFFFSNSAGMSISANEMTKFNFNLIPWGEALELLFILILFIYFCICIWSLSYVIFYIIVLHYCNVFKTSFFTRTSFLTYGCSMHNKTVQMSVMET